MSRMIDLPSLETVRAPSVADQIFATLYHRVITLELPPGARLSEAEVARQMGVSRQPVRDAFWRLSQLGFLTIRPQRATDSQPDLRAVGRAGAFHPHRSRGRDGAGGGRAAQRRRHRQLAAAARRAGGRGARRRPRALPRARRRLPPDALRARRPRFRLGAHPRAQGAHGPGPVPEPRLQRRAGAGRPPGDSRRARGRRYRGGRRGHARAPRAHLARSSRGYATSTPTISTARRGSRSPRRAERLGPPLDAPVGAGAGPAGKKSRAGSVGKILLTRTPCSPGRGERSHKWL